MPAGLDGDRQLPRVPDRARALAAGDHPSRWPPTSSRWSPARTPRSPPSTTASCSACMPGPRSPSTCTPRPPTSWPSPQRPWTATTSCSASGTRSTSTTRPSCRTSTPAPWRTPAASRCATSTSSARRPPGASAATRASTIAHEMAHMWFGDLVTMRWWDDLWLNESFAEYMGYRVCAELAGGPSSAALAARCCLAGVRAAPQGLGPGRRPGAVEAPGGRQRLRGRRRRAGRLRRHLLRQGRLGAQATGGPPRRRGVLRRAAAALLRGTGSATPSSPT